MGQGILSGAVLGLIVSAVVLSVASLIAEQPPGNAPPAAPQIEGPEAAEADAPTDEAAGVGTSEIAAAPEAAGPSRPDAPEEETGPALETTPPERPVEGGAAPELGTAGEVDTAPEGASAEEPVLAPPQGMAPATPVTESDLEVSTRPATPPAPEPPVAPTSDTEEGEPGIETEASPAPDPAEADAAPVLPEDPGADAAPELPSVDGATDAPVIVEVVPETEAGEGDTPPEAAETAEGSEETEETEETEAAPTSRFALQSETGTGLPGSQPDPGDGAAEAEPAMEDDGPSDALSRFGTPFEGDGRPVLSILLLDEGALGDAAPALAALPVPVTVAVEATDPAAAERAGTYRAAGLEVAAMSPLPEGAAPQDVEVAMEAAFLAVPEAVAMIGDGGGLQSGREATEQAMAALSEAGRGFVTQARGLNSALRAAAGAEVPALEIYRDLDDEGQDARVIRRFLEQAAFRARQEGAVVVLGRVRPDTISALMLWGTANLDGQVAIAPLSAQLLAQRDGG